METGPPQTPVFPPLVHTDTQRPKRGKFTGIGTLALLGGHSGKDAK